jgi:hypothetical protein
MKNLLAIFFLIFSAISCAQSKKVKIYAYQQQVLPGVRAITVDESGVTNEVSKKMVANNFIYIEAPVDKKIEPKHIWIDGKLYGLKTSIPQLPVVMHNATLPSKKGDTLVRLTEKAVMQLQPVADSSVFSPSASAKKKMKSHQVVLHTIENGKNCYYYLERIKILDPVALQ